jgi:hypothetical protein
MATTQERIEAAKARKAAVEKRLTPEVLEAIKDRDEAERLEAEVADLEAKERGHVLAVAVERLSEKYGPHLRAIDLESRQPGHGTWIVMPASGDVMKAFHAEAKKPKADSDAINRMVAEECVVYWNGADEDAIDGEKMHLLWDTFGAIPTTLGNAAVELGGFVADTRSKSG